jgi:hypothetical protein
MKEKPILFSGPMVRAILDGRKTQTRRVVKWPMMSDSDGSKRRVLIESDAPLLQEILKGPFRNPLTRFSPYGAPGDRLWVRETFAMGEGVIYKAEWDETCPGISLKGHWKPSIFMPRTLCRITLEVVSVRVERLQDITEGDAVAEGCADSQMVEGVPMWTSAVEAYAELWDKINGAGAWDANPWVWVVEFKRI